VTARFGADERVPVEVLKAWVERELRGHRRARRKKLTRKKPAAPKRRAPTKRPRGSR
jgi:hypothetical protein